MKKLLFFILFFVLMFSAVLSETIIPIVSFGPLTLPDGAFSTGSDILIDLDIEEENPNQIIYTLYNTTEIMSEYTTNYYYGFDLDKYIHIVNDKTLNAQPELSALTYNPESQTLFAIHAYGVTGINNLSELNTNGTPIRTIVLKGYEDVEGIAYVNSSGNSHRFAIVEERKAILSHIVIDDATISLNKSQGKSYDLGLGFLDNLGIEGVAYDKNREVYYIVKEKSNKKVYKVNLSTGAAVTTLLFDAESLPILDLSDLYYDENTDTLFLLSHESKSILNVGLSGNVISSLNVNLTQAEGVTFDTSGKNLYVIGEPRQFSKLSTSSFNSHHTFQLLPLGTYQYRSTVFDSSNNTSSTPLRTITLQEELIPPISDAGSDVSASQGEIIFFNGSNSYDSDGQIVEYIWNFGDGATAQGPTASHPYDSDGLYTVSLTVTDNHGLTAVDTLSVTITPVPSLPQIHVGNITLTGETKSKGKRAQIITCRVTATVPILDESNKGVQDATVQSLWTGSYIGSSTTVTPRSGKAVFTTNWIDNCGTFTITINNVSAANVVYNPSQNTETTDSFTFQ